MNNEQRAKRATDQDSDHAVRIVRDLMQIEDDYHQASMNLSEALMRAAVQAIKKAVPAPAQVIENDWTATIAFPEWKARGVGQDAAIELSEIAEEGADREYTWLTAATAVGPTRLSLELVFRPGLRDAARALIADDEKMRPIWKSFMRSEGDFRLFIPIIISPTVLAEGFATNDLDKATAPVTKVVQQVLAAKKELDEIVEAVRAAAKGSK